MRGRERRRGHVSHERWLVSYADFITLMFAFFVVLYASSKADLRKQQMISQSIDSAFRQLGIFPNATRKPVDPTQTASAAKDAAPMPMNVVMGEDVMSPAEVKRDLERMQSAMEHMLSDQIAKHTVAIQMGKDGLVISLREAGFFSSGSAVPHAQTLPVLRQIAQVLGPTGYNVRVEGHTDNVPIHNAEFDSNWELSAARATHIGRTLLETRAIAPERISVAGYAEYHPVASNDTENGRAENRRVDLVIAPKTRVNLAMPDGDAAKANWRRITD
ncbi:flagellar motor protein MotB [Acidicapsa dinghuensis]|uniref:Flagellar motor protein MotB n=1 Tax=Acidicapsa dinghuensis TaxID=2218256 RepID=A0ABW1ENT8_9BACT|nr:flagellar motor protein MotB [Acidicapsa dinghuensis]